MHANESRSRGQTFNPVGNRPEIYMRKMILAALRKSMLNVLDPRFYETERGYQGALIAQLTIHLELANLNGHPIIEQEYQKTLPNHGIAIRPDVIIHTPYVAGGFEDRRRGNFVAIEIKRRANIPDAEADYQSLALLAERLAYPLTVFVNIDSTENHHRNCPAGIAEQTISIAVRLEDGVPTLYSSDLT
jgi:hypothetical protein